MKHFFILIFFNGLFSIVQITFAQNNPVIVIDGKKQNISPKNEQFLILEDIDDRLTVRHLEDKMYQKKFVPFAQVEAQIKPYTTYWLKLQIQNTADRDLDWILTAGESTQAEVYILDAKGKISIKKSGQFIPLKERDINQGKYNKVNLFLRHKSLTTVYIKLRNEINYPPHPELNLRSYQNWQSFLMSANMLQGIFQGLLLMILLYNLFLYLYLRDKAYLWYVLYVATTSFYFLDFYEYFEEYAVLNQPVITFIYTPFSAYFAFIFYLELLRAFLKTPSRMLRANRLLIQIEYLFASLTLFLMVLATFNYENYLVIEKYFYFLITALTIFALLLIYRKTDITSQFFTWGTIAMLLGMTIMMLGFLKVIKANIYYYQVGIVAEVLIFALGLSYRYKQSEEIKRKTQEQLIKQLKDNEAIKDKMNQQLEQKVKERTADIEKQKEEIKAQAEEIQTQSDEIMQQNELLEYKNKQIVDSIAYARRIQTAILPSENFLQENFSDGFVFYQPRDVVSGDFYWFAEITLPSQAINASICTQGADNESSLWNKVQQNLQNITLTSENNSSKVKIIINADCTGHGVPGAFMTIMGNTLLDYIINQQQIYQPDIILEELDKGLKKTLNQYAQQANRAELKDGMCLTILTYYPKQEIIQFAGAKNYVWFLRNDEISLWKGAKRSIGDNPKEESMPFEAKTIKIQAGDIFYMTSDGFQDQFGGAENKKFMSKNLQKLLTSHHQLPFETQKRIYAQTFNDWKGAHHQTDDVLLMGFKL